jgi:hypothetical protein
MKIVIYNEPAYRTGGVESIYQFCDTVNRLGGECYIKFVNNDHANPIPDEYKRYRHVRITNKVEDNENMLVVYAEIWTGSLQEFKNCKKAVWWLSVDNNKNNFKDFNNSDILHLYQSEYANQFLIKNGITNILPVFDYIDGIDNNKLPKRDIITFNPLKGLEATMHLIKNSQKYNLQFVPLQDMSKEQIIQILKQSKVYIDFGHHPGRDRIPREAALCDNIILTSCFGSAKNDLDVPISNKFKLRELTSQTPDLLRDALKNYNTLITEFIPYINVVQNDKQTHEKQILNLLQRFT